MLRRSHERAITTALVVSALLHVAAFMRLPRFEWPTSELTHSGEMPGELSVRIIPAPRSAAPPRPPAVMLEAPRASAPAPRARAPRSAPPPRARPPVLASREPSSSPVPPPAPQTAPAPAPPTTDFASLVEARRRARGETAPAPSEASAPAAESAKARANRLAAANLAAGRDLTFGIDPRRSGGIFQITTKTYDYAEFVFFGWNREARRNLPMVISVSKGGNPTIELAVVRKMIAIIRDYEQEDFIWESERLGRNVTLSARQRDTRGLEDFLMKEFFSDGRRR